MARPTPTIRPTPTPRPAPTTTPEPLTTIPAENYATFPLLAIRAEGPCAIKVDHALMCWGASDGFVPTGTFKAVGTDEWGACALRDNGKAVCWSSELETAPKGRFKAMSPGGRCGIRVDDTLACWYTTDDQRLKFAKVPGGQFVTLSDGCALRADGSAACWDELDGAPPDGSGPFAQIDGPCGIRADGSLLCWSTYPEINRAAPTGPFSAVAANQVGGCAIRTGGELACWGDALLGYDAETDEAVRYAPPEGRFTSVTLGESRSCALREDGIAVCWGEDAEAPAPGAVVYVLAKPPYHEFPDLLITGRRIPVRWKARPVSAPIASVDLGYTWSRWDGASSSNEEAETDEPVTWRTAAASGSATFKGERGYTYCFTAEATDTDGAKGDGYSPCASIPLDDRDLEASAGWSKLQGSRFYESTALRAINKGRTLTLPKIGSLALGVIATTCPTCGTIEVSFGGNGSTNEDDGDQSGSYRISLRSSRTVNRALVFLTDNGQEGVAGKLTIRVVSSGKPVIIDGVVLAPYET